MDWARAAQRLADTVAEPPSRWHDPVAAIPRHLFVPRWWEPARAGGGWVLRDGPSDPDEWVRAAYANRSLVTRVGALHADHAGPDDAPAGLPTSSATMPGLTVQMLRHARITDDADVLDVGTGSGYSCALLSARLGAARVTSVDVDPYLVEAATKRLDQAGLHPTVATVDATGPLPTSLLASFDRIIATVAVRPIPPTWLTALRPGGLLVTTIRDLSIIVIAGKSADGGATGATARDWAMFMATRTGPDYPSDHAEQLAAIRDADGDHIGPGRPYPIPEVVECWELRSMLELAAPGIIHRYEQTPDGGRRAWMLHPDGSWARAAAVGDAPPTVHQAGPRRLWDLLDELRTRWLREGRYPLYGARVRIDPDGTVHLARGSWKATIG